MERCVPEYKIARVVWPKVSGYSKKVQTISLFSSLRDIWGGRISVKSSRLATLMGETKIFGEKHGHVWFCPSIISHELGRDWTQSLVGESLVTNSLNRGFISCISCLSHSKHSASAKKTVWLMLFSEIIAVYWVNSMKYVYTRCRIFVSLQVIHVAIKLLQWIKKRPKVMIM